MVAPLALYTSAVQRSPLAVSLPFGILVLWADCQGPDCLAIDLSRMVEDLIQAFSLSLQDMLLVSQQLSSICTEKGRGARILWSINSVQGIIGALGAMAVCVTLDFTGVLAILCVPYYTELHLHLLFSVYKGIFPCLLREFILKCSEPLVFFLQQCLYLFLILIEAVLIAAVVSPRCSHAVG